MRARRRLGSELFGITGCCHQKAFPLFHSDRTQTAPTKKGKLRDRDPRPSAAVGSVGTVALSARTRAPHCHGDRCDRCAPFATLQRAPSQTEMALERVDTGECCTHTHPMTCSSNGGSRQQRQARPRDGFVHATRCACHAVAARRGKATVDRGFACVSQWILSPMAAAQGVS